ncbi:MAG: Protein tyrosine/serine phosphatase [Rhodobacteraceae bacterium HLUCCA08]|nr:MAG: Protein tyrosine/serine phosphatase [Rhodobacteraceae bacterium HLUCCA08]
MSQANTTRPPDHDLGTLRGRIGARLHFLFIDHQLLRLFWRNTHEIAPGVWRSNQPGPARLRRFRARGIRTVLTLRADLPRSYTLLEARACARLGLRFVRGPSLAARVLLPRDRLLALEARFRELQDAKPLVMHCKSGADRTGLGAALWLVLIEGRDVQEVLDTQFTRARIHFPRSRAGVVSHIFRAYLREAEGRDFRSWLLTDYDPDRLTADFADWRDGRGRWATRR